MYDNPGGFYRESWRLEAACATSPPRWFFPVREQPAALEVRKARQVCGVCPVKVQCLDRALDVNTPGIWGATTQAQRKPFLKADDVDHAIDELLEIGRLSLTTGLFRAGNDEDWVMV